MRIGAIAVSPTTRDYRRYLYAVDQGNGTLMVYDITDPALSPPHRRSALTPSSIRSCRKTGSRFPRRWPPSASFSTIGPSCRRGRTETVKPRSNPRVLGPPLQPQSERASRRRDVREISARTTEWIRPLPFSRSGTVSTVQGFPERLRGIFGFATLASGQVFAIDVDDWDAPCRRPDPMTTDPTPLRPPNVEGYGMTGLLDLPEPAAGAPDAATYLDPYHAPYSYQTSLPESPAVTQEAFFPVSAPNRIRSSSLLRNDPTSGNHLPNVVGIPQLFDSLGSPVSAAGMSAPEMLPTALPPGFVDPTYDLNPTEADPLLQTAVELPGNPQTPAPATFPSAAAVPGVRLTFDDPTVAITQNWSVTYEGVLPSSPQAVAADIDTPDGYRRR